MAADMDLDRAMERLVRDVLDREWGPDSDWPSSRAAQVVVAPPAARRLHGGRPLGYLAAAALLILLALAATALLTASRPPPAPPAGSLAIAHDGGLDLAAWDGSIRRSVFPDGPAFIPAWSPDGSRLAFSQLTERDANMLRVTDRGGRLLLEHPGVFEFEWADDAGAIAFADPQSRIRVLETTSQRDVLLLQPETRYTGLGFDWSPDGMRVVVAVCTDCAPEVVRPRHELWLLDRELRPPARLVGRGPGTASEGGYGPAWSPDGSAVAFVVSHCADLSCPGAIRVIDARSGALQLEIEEVWAGDDLAWSPDSRHLAYVARIPGDGGPIGQAEIFITDVAAGSTRRLTTAPGDDYQPAWNAQGSWLLFSRAVQRDQVPIEIWATTADGTTSVRLADDAHAAAWQSSP